MCTYSKAFICLKNVKLVNPDVHMDNPPFYNLGILLRRNWRTGVGVWLNPHQAFLAILSWFRKPPPGLHLLSSHNRRGLSESEFRSGSWVRSLEILWLWNKKVYPTVVPLGTSRFTGISIIASCRHLEVISNSEFLISSLLCTCLLASI